MLSRSSCFAHAPDKRLSGCRALHSRRLLSAPRSRPAAPRLSHGKTLGDADYRNQPSTACSAFFSGWQEPSKQDDEDSQQRTDSSGEEEAAVPEDDDEQQYTALTAACMSGDNERIRGLLACGANPDIASEGLPRPLLISCCEADAEAVQDLLRAGANPEALPGEIYSPLEVAGSLGHVEVVGALLRGGANPMAVSQGSTGRTPIGMMCGGLESDLPGPVRAEVVQLLLQAGADPRVGRAGAIHNALNGDEGSGGSKHGAGGAPRPIQLAVYKGIAEVIPVLVAAGEDPGRAPASGMSFEEFEAGAIPPLLIMAAMKGHVDVVQALVAAGADVEVKLGGVQGRQDGGRAGGGWGGGGGGGVGDGEWSISDGLTPLCVAVRQGHVDVVRALVAAGADTRVHGTTLLQMARKRGMKEIEEVLQAAGAEWN